MIAITENDNGTIKAVASLSGMNIDEVQIEAEYDPGDPGRRTRYGKEGIIDMGEPYCNPTCEITRVFIDITPAYGEQNLDMTRLHEEISAWEDELILEIEKKND